MNSARAIILVMDSVGVGQADDAAAYGDMGADTLGNIVEAAANGNADQAGVRAGPLASPNLASMGIEGSARASRGRALATGLGGRLEPDVAFGYAVPTSVPKGSTGGHWEIAGLRTTADWGHFGEDPAQPYPPELISRLVEACELPGVIEVGRASGTEVIAHHGEQHLRTGKPIVYTSTDSVFQIAAHESVFGLERLYTVCEAARELCDEHRIARVIARPFVGNSADSFTRTEQRRDFSMPPHGPTLLGALSESGMTVTTIGKIGDLFAHRGIQHEYPVTELDEVFDQVLESLDEQADPGLIFVNFCDFDSRYGHRRDVIGYANELERFDNRLSEVRCALGDEDLLIVTADHGNDPTFGGSDHTRENVPVLVCGPGIASGDFGRRTSFADIGATAARHLGLVWPGAGTPIQIESDS
ncbi:phosphopentomutase [Salinisphaera orenii]|uniref:phosphopentomutase n=1 Tax=Salinisphaera orenii TaxID=856731 RepID=UPI000DBE0B40